MSSQNLRVAVDGGQSEVRIRVADDVAPVAVEGFGRFDGDPIAGLIGRVRDGLAKAGVAGRPIAKIVLGLTTAPSSARESRELVARIGTELDAAEVALSGDALTAHAGAFAGASGVVLTVGTGIACLGFDTGSGALRCVDGDGFLLGDAGGAFWIGSRGIEAVLRARDGRGPETALDAAVDERFGVHDVLAAELHSRRRAVSEIASFAMDVQAAAAAGDPVATQLIAAAADELRVTVSAAAAVVGAAEGVPTPVAVSGRAIAADTTLGSAFAERMAADGRLRLTAAIGDPLDGAWRVARDADLEIYHRHMTTWRHS